MTELIPNLFIGNWHEAKASQGFHVVTCASDSEFVGDAHFPLIDGPGNTQELFDSAVKHVSTVYGNVGKILVHCVGGRSRSASVIVAAAATITGRSLCEIYDLLLQKHDITRIHPYLALLLLKRS